jgi:hypothetical protein
MEHFLALGRIVSILPSGATAWTEIVSSNEDVTGSTSLFDIMLYSKARELVNVPSCLNAIALAPNLHLVPSVLRLENLLG